MKIQKINNYSLFKSNTKTNYTNSIKYEGCDLSFKSNMPKNNIGFFDKIKSLFKKETIPNIASEALEENTSDLSEEKKVSEEIKNFVSTTIQCYDTMTDYGNTSSKRIKRMLFIGKQFDYRGYIPYGKENLTFGYINEETKIPKSVSTWKNGKYLRTYEIEETSPELKYKITTNDNNIKTEYVGIGSDIIYMKQTDNNKHSFFTIHKKEAGFDVVYGIDNGSEKQILQSLNYDFQDYRWCLYFLNSDEGIQMYLYNPDKDMWINRATIASQIVNEED